MLCKAFILLSLYLGFVCSFEITGDIKTLTQVNGILSVAHKITFTCGGQDVSSSVTQTLIVNETNGEQSEIIITCLPPQYKSLLTPVMYIPRDKRTYEILMCFVENDYTSNQTNTRLYNSDDPNDTLGFTSPQDIQSGEFDSTGNLDSLFSVQKKTKRHNGFENQKHATPVPHQKFHITKLITLDNKRKNDTEYSFKKKRMSMQAWDQTIEGQGIRDIPGPGIVDTLLCGFGVLGGDHCGEGGEYETLKKTMAQLSVVVGDLNTTIFDVQFQLQDVQSWETTATDTLAGLVQFSSAQDELNKNFQLQLSTISDAVQREAYIQTLFQDALNRGFQNVSLLLRNISAVENLEQQYTYSLFEKSDSRINITNSRLKNLEKAVFALSKAQYEIANEIVKKRAITQTFFEVYDQITDPTSDQNTLYSAPDVFITNMGKRPLSFQERQNRANYFFATRISSVVIQYSVIDGSNTVAKQVNYSLVCDTETFLNETTPGMDLITFFDLIGPPTRVGDPSSACHLQSPWTCKCVFLKETTTCPIQTQPDTSKPQFPFQWRQTKRILYSPGNSSIGYCTTTPTSTSVANSNPNIYASMDTWYQELSATCREMLAAVPYQGYRVRLFSDYDNGFINLTMANATEGSFDMCNPDIFFFGAKVDNSKRFPFHLYLKWQIDLSVTAVLTRKRKEHEYFGQAPSDLNDNPSTINNRARADLTFPSKCSSMSFNTISKEKLLVYLVEPPTVSKRVFVQTRKLGTNTVQTLFSGVINSNKTRLSVLHSEYPYTDTSLSDVDLENDYSYLLPGNADYLVQDIGYTDPLARDSNGDPIQVVVDYPPDSISIQSPRNKHGTISYISQRLGWNVLKYPLNESTFATDVAPVNSSTPITLAEWMRNYDSRFDSRESGPSALQFTKRVTFASESSTRLSCQESLNYTNGGFGVDDRARESYSLCSRLEKYQIFTEENAGQSDLPPERRTRTMTHQPYDFTLKATIEIPMGPVISLVQSSCPTSVEVQYNPSGTSFVTFNSSSVTEQTVRVTVHSSTDQDETSYCNYNYPDVISVSKPLVVPIVSRETPCSPSGFLVNVWSLSVNPTTQQIEYTPCLPSDGVKVNNNFSISPSQGPDPSSYIATKIVEIDFNSKLAQAINLIFASVAVSMRAIIASQFDDQAATDQIQNSINGIYNQSTVIFNNFANDSALNTAINDAQQGIQDDLAALTALSAQAAQIIKGQDAGLLILASRMDQLELKLNISAVDLNKLEKDDNKTSQDIGILQADIAEFLKSKSTNGNTFCLGIPFIGNLICDISKTIFGGLGSIFTNMISTILNFLIPIAIIFGIYKLYQCQSKRRKEEKEDERDRAAKRAYYINSNSTQATSEDLSHPNTSLKPIKNN